MEECVDKKIHYLYSLILSEKFVMKMFYKFSYYNYIKSWNFFYNFCSQILQMNDLKS